MFGLQIKYLSFFFGLISILSFFNIIYSYYFNLYLNLDTYYLSLFLSSTLAILFYSLKILPKKTSIFQKILTVFLGYILLPLILSIPFYLSIYNLTFINSFFEAVSGFTSTGFTIFENIKNIDQSLILWRSTTQWIGGLYFLFSIIYLIDIYDENFKKTLTNFDEDISLLHLDVDIHSSYDVALELLKSRVVNGGAIIIDEYNSKRFSNIKKVVDNHLAKNKYDFYNSSYKYFNRAYFIKK